MAGSAYGMAHVEIWAMLLITFFVIYLQVASLEIADHFAGVLTSDTACIVWHF